MRSRYVLALAALAAASSLSSSALAVSDVYAIDVRTSPHRLIRFPANAPALNVVSSSAGFNGFAMDFDASATTLYGITNVTAGAQVFGTINQSTGNFTAIANVTGAGSTETNWSGLSVAPDGTFYASSSGGAGLNNLYTINPTTGVTTLVAPIGAGTAALNIDIAIDRNGQMYGHDIAADKVFKIDKSNGAVTFLGAGTTGFASNFAQGMDFDWDTNTLYATLYTGGGTGAYVSIDTTTGAATSLLSTTSWNAEMEMAVKSPIPEPAAVALVGATGTTLLGRRRRRA